MRYGLHSSLFFIVLGMWFHLVRLACMAILISLWHSHTTSILWVYLSLFLLRGVARPDHGLGSISQYRRDLCQGLCQGLVGHLWLRGLTWSVGMRLIWVARSLLVAVSPPVLLRLGERGPMGVGTPDVPQSSASSASPSTTSAAFQVGRFFKFFNQWRSITSNRFVLNMVWGHHLQLRSHPPLFHNSWQFNVKVAAAHHPVIQKEVDELLAKGAVEPSSGGAGFYSSMFVVPKHTSHPYLTWSILIVICMYHLLRSLLVDMYGSLSSVVIMLLPLIYRMLIYIFLLLSIIVISYVCIIKLLQHHLLYIWYLFAWVSAITLQLQFHLLDFIREVTLTKFAIDLYKVWR